MATKKVRINRAPVMTLWGAVVAEQLGFDREEALTLGRAVAGLNAQAKGQRLGIFEPGKESGEKARERKADEVYSIQLLGRPVPAINTPDGVRAVDKGKPANPSSVQRYLKGKFGEDLDEVRAAMQDLAKSFDQETLARRSYDLYEQFRPEIPAGKRGWGAEGELDLEFIRSLGT